MKSLLDEMHRQAKALDVAREGSASEDPAAAHNAKVRAERLQADLDELHIARNDNLALASSIRASLRNLAAESHKSEMRSAATLHLLQAALLLEEEAGREDAPTPAATAPSTSPTPAPAGEAIEPHATPSPPHIGLSDEVVAAAAPRLSRPELQEMTEEAWTNGLRSNETRGDLRTYIDAQMIHHAAHEARLLDGRLHLYRNVIPHGELLLAHLLAMPATLLEKKGAPGR